MFRHLCVPLAAVTTFVWQAAGMPATNADDGEGASVEIDHRAVRVAIGKSITLLEHASAGSAEQRKCFNCHGQAIPVFALSESREFGFEVDQANYERQVQHTHDHLRRGKKSYLEGKGQGGGVDTAGYALWTLDAAERSPDEVTDYVIDWVLGKQKDNGRWACSSKRPPSEASDFATTYLAIRALEHFATGERSSDASTALEQSFSWLETAKPKDTEDHVFRLLSLSYLDAQHPATISALEQLRDAQREDGGWAQLESMKSDAYATGTAMYALSECGVAPNDPTWQAGVAYLLNDQHDDGSWRVESRSKPFQKYFESGFPHGKDQFISMTASAWATIALLRSLPGPRVDGAKRDESDEKTVAESTQ